MNERHVLWLALIGVVVFLLVELVVVKRRVDQRRAIALEDHKRRLRYHQ